MVFRKSFFTILSIFGLVLYSGCAAKKVKKSANEPAVAESIRESESAAQHSSMFDPKIVRSQLDRVIAEAEKKGPAAKKYFSTDLFIKANDAAIRGNSKLAVILFEYVLKLAPENHFIKRKYVVELIRTGELEKAEPLLKEVYQSKENSDENLGLILGGLYSALSKSKEAKKTYAEVLKKYPKSSEACVFLSKTYVGEKNYRKANAILSACEKRNKKSGIFSYYKGKMSLERDQIKKAMTHFKKSLNVEPSFYQSALALGLIYEEKKNFSRAKKVYLKYLRKRPDSFAILQRLVQIMFAKEEFKEVIPYAERLSYIDPSDLNLKLRLGILYTNISDLDKAIGVFKEILASVPDSDKILFYLGSLYQQRGQVQTSLTYFSKISKDSSLFHDSSLQIAQILNNLAYEEHLKGSAGKKMNELEEFVRKHGEDPTLKVKLSIVMAGFYESVEKYEMAIEVLERVRNEEDFSKEQVFYLASLYEKTKNFATSDKIIENILEKEPEDPHALNFLGYSYLERDYKLDLALKYIKKAVKLRPDDGYIRDSLGWYYYKTGKLKLALKELKIAFNLVSNDLVIVKHLAIVYKKLKSYDLAKKFYLEALKVCKVESERKEVTKELEELENIRLPASEQF